MHTTICLRSHFMVTDIFCVVCKRENLMLEKTSQDFYFYRSTQDKKYRFFAKLMIRILNVHFPCPAKMCTFACGASRVGISSAPSRTFPRVADGHLQDRSESLSPFLCYSQTLFMEGRKQRS